MDFGAGTYALGFIAGALSVLSPCVLPLVPILLAAAASAHRFGALALSTGLMLSFMNLLTNILGKASQVEIDFPKVALKQAA